MAEAKKKGTLTKIAEFQQEVPPIFKGTEGFGYKFADWTSILAIINPLMKKHGLGFTQGVEADEHGDFVTSTIFSVDDNKDAVTSRMRFLEGVTLKGQSAPQVRGSMITYWKRYLLSAQLGLVTDSDTDAASVDSNVTKRKVSEYKKETSTLSEMTEETKAAMISFIKEGKHVAVTKRLPLYKDSPLKEEVTKELSNVK